MNSLIDNLIPKSCPIGIISDEATPINHINGAKIIPIKASNDRLLYIELDSIIPFKPVKSPNWKSI